MEDYLSKPRVLTQSEKEYFLSLKTDDITTELLNSLFSDRYDAINGVRIKSKYNTYDLINLKANEYFNKEDIKTNCGLFIINKYLIEPDFKDVIGYCNTPLNKKELSKLDKKLSNCILEDEITTEQYINYLNRLCQIAFSFNTQICSSISLKSYMPIPKVAKRKKELIKQYEKEIDEGDVSVVLAIEKELLDIAKKELEEDPSMELYDSGARGAFDNAYKTAQIWKGAVYNESKKKFEVVKHSWYEGLSNDEFSIMGGSVINTQYPKAIGTAVSGYMAKTITAAFQSIVLDEKGTDCGTKQTNTVILTPNNANYYMHSFMVTKSGKLVKIELSNIESLYNKQIEVRSLQYCINEKKCNMCAGDRFYMLDIDKIGLTFSRIASSTLRAKMKANHDATVKANVISLDYAWGVS